MSMYKLTTPEFLHLHFEILAGCKGGSSNGQVRHNSVERALSVVTTQLFVLGVNSSLPLPHRRNE